jgi:hypothetical protein
VKARGPAQAGTRHSTSHTSSGPRLALGLTEAAEAIGVSLDFFSEHVRPELRVVRRGRKVIVSVRELEKWLAEHAERVLDD